MLWTPLKSIHGFDLKLHIWGYVKRDTAIQALEDFVRKSPDFPNDIKIITCALMGHGVNMKTEMAEADW